MLLNDQAREEANRPRVMGGKLIARPALGAWVCLGLRHLQQLFKAARKGQAVVCRAVRSAVMKGNQDMPMKTMNGFFVAV